MKSKFYLQCLACLSVLSVFFLQSCNEEEGSISSSNSNSYDKELQTYLQQYEVVNIDVASLVTLAESKPTQSVAVNLNIPSKPSWNFDMTVDETDEDFLSDFKVILVGDGNTLEEKAKPDTYALQAKLAGSDVSYFVFGNDQFEASIMDQGKEYYLEPVSNFVNGADKNLYVLYNVEDLVKQKLGCQEMSVNNTSGSIQKSYGSPSKPWKVSVTMVSDYQVYTKFYNWTNTYYYLYYRLYYTNRRHVNNSTSARLQLKNVYIYWTYGSRNYPPNSNNLSTSLTQSTSYYNAGWYGSGDLNYFITGDRVDNYAGMAYLGTICAYPSVAFGIGIYYPAGTIANNLMAHETGHNMGMDHDSSRQNIMYPSLNYSLTFTSFSKSQLQNRLNNQSSCLNH